MSAFEAGIFGLGFHCIIEALIHLRREFLEDR